VKVKIKDFDVDMDLGNNGISLQVRTNGENSELLGTLRLGRAKVEWSKGKKVIRSLKWNELIDIFEGL
jgi:hypothetical protein